MAMNREHAALPTIHSHALREDLLGEQVDCQPLEVVHAPSILYCILEYLHLLARPINFNDANLSVPHRHCGHYYDHSERQWIPVKMRGLPFPTT